MDKKIKKNTICGADQEKLTINGIVMKKIIKDKASILAINTIKHKNAKDGKINVSDSKNNINLIHLFDKELLFKLGVNFSSTKFFPLK